ncbi:MAG: hypothetical protein H6838_05280 [Planctomycetes bacterium]|nr:hypothetical protein [Planctomycetota bacterium]
MPCAAPRTSSCGGPSARVGTWPRSRSSSGTSPGSCRCRSSRRAASAACRSGCSWRARRGSHRAGPTTRGCRRRARRPGPLVFAPAAAVAPVLAAAALAAARGAHAGELRVVLGPVELERDDPRGWPWPVPVSFLVGRTPLQLADDLAAADAFVGNDSGATHLAAMLGVPTVAVFGPTDPEVWAPVGPHVRVVGGDMLSFPEVGAVAAALGA